MADFFSWGWEVISRIIGFSADGIKISDEVEVSHSILVGTNVFSVWLRSFVTIGVKDS